MDEQVPPSNGPRETARVDGCPELGALLRIVLPVARPGFVAGSIVVKV